MATINTAQQLVLLVVLLAALQLPLSTLSSRTGPPSTHHGGGHGHVNKPAPTPPPVPSAAAAQLVRATCNQTTYYDVCVSALGADPSAVDVRGLSAIAVSAAAVNASGGAATAAALLAANATEQQQQALLRACAAKYGQARDALSAAGESIAGRDYDYASVHVSAAAEYPQVCRALFRRQRYPPELAAREEELAKLCSVALDVIALLSNGSSN